MRSSKYGRKLEEYEVRRYEELCELFRKLYNKKYDGQVVNQNTQETLADIACSKRRYNDIAKYYISERRKKLSEIEMVEVEVKRFPEQKLLVEMISHLTQNEAEQLIKQENSDMLAASEVYAEAFDLMKSRNAKYGDSWKVLSIQSLANLCEMKLHRIANLDKLEPKIKDELIDVLNYCVFGLLKLRGKQHN